MQLYPHTLIVRHRRENLQKCSLHGLEDRNDIKFFRYPFGDNPISLNQPLLLVMEGAPLLEKADRNRILLLIDSTWRHVPKMVRAIEDISPVEKRTLPAHFKTAYPRRQEDCIDPKRGLASIEALFIAYSILGRETKDLLKNYYWKEDFLKINNLI